VVPNGIPLSKIHHAAFDGHLIGIDEDFRIHVASRLLRQEDGELLEALEASARRGAAPSVPKEGLAGLGEFRGYE